MTETCGAVDQRLSCDERVRAQALAATLRNLTCAWAQSRDGGARPAFEFLRRTWVSPAHQARQQRPAAMPWLADQAHQGASPESDRTHGRDAQARTRHTVWTLLERLSLGDLTRAADQLDQPLAEIAADHQDAEAWVGMLRTELELLHGELLIAQGRGQLQHLIVGVLAAEQLLPLLKAILPGWQPPAAGRFEPAPARSEHPPPAADPRIRMLHAALELLHRELSLMQRRGLVPWPAPGATEARAAAGEAATSQADTQGKGLPHPQRLDALAMSQLGQDLWVLERTGDKEGGFFVEFGATDGVLLSNTWLLENHFGWQGLCAEPNPRFFPQLQANRRCGLSDQYIGGTTGEQVDFVLADAYGGSATHINDDNNANRRAGYKSAGRMQQMTSISLHDFLIQHQAPQDIDYISIDTEGSEYEILSQFPFDQWRVRLFSIEHNFTKMREPIRALMEQHGYVCQEAQWDDWYERVT